MILMTMLMTVHDFFITVLGWLLVGEGVGVDEEDRLGDKQIILLPATTSYSGLLHLNLLLIS